MNLEQETMKDMSLFLLKNAFGAKVKKGFRNFCNGDTSTSTLDQQKLDHFGGSASSASYVAVPLRPLVTSPVRKENQPTTLEEMILQLEMEEKKMGRRRRERFDDNSEGIIKHRMSCVDSSDILRTARNALNQYPRFSLDGKDAMYRSSFTNLAAPIRAGKLIHRSHSHETGTEKSRRLPAVVAGESVIWCKPGVVAKLMGLDAMPIPLNSNNKRERLSAIIKRQNARQRAKKPEVERRRAMMSDANVGAGTRRGTAVGACSRTGYCVMNHPVGLMEFPNDDAGWPMRRFL